MFVVGSWYNLYIRALSKPLTCSAASQSAAGVPCAAQDWTAEGSGVVRTSAPERLVAAGQQAEEEEQEQTAAAAAGQGARVLHTRHGASGAE